MSSALSVDLRERVVRAVEAARTIPDLWAAIKRSLTRFQPAECRSYLAAAGYDAT